MSDHGLEQYIEALREKRQKIEEMKRAFLITSQREPDEFKRATGKMFAKYADTMEYIFMNIEMLALMNLGLKNQNEVLKDIVIQLPEVKAESRIQLNIDSAFREYNEKLKKLYDEFLESQGESTKSTKK